MHDRRSWWRLGAIAMASTSAIGLVAGCEGRGDATAVTPGDRAAYGADVEPVLAARCATLDCHGDPGRPLRLYSTTGLRADDSLRGRDAGLTDDEIDDNIAAIAAVDPGAPAEAHLLVRKPLAEIGHEGGRVWASRSEAQVVCVQGWLGGKSLEPAVAAACVTARTEVAPAP
jgi:hypothetical protein